MNASNKNFKNLESDIINDFCSHTEFETWESMVYNLWKRGKCRFRILYEKWMAQMLWTDYDNRFTRRKGGI